MPRGGQGSLSCHLCHLSLELVAFRWLSGKESACSAGDTEDAGSILGPEDPLEKEMATHSSVLACEIPWTEAPGGPHHGVAKSRTRLSD